MKTIKKYFFTLLAIAIVFFFFSKCNIKSDKENSISFYGVSLGCQAVPNIGCGNIIKPFFIDAKQDKQIKETWSNRAGSVIAIIWNEPFLTINERERLCQSLFEKHGIEAKLILNNEEIDRYIKSMETDKWYKGFEVDELSLEEAAIISEDLAAFTQTQGLINANEKLRIAKDLETYFKKELLDKRACDKLKLEETRNRWHEDSYQIYVLHIGKERADSIADFFNAYEIKKQEKCLLKIKKAVI